MQQLRLRLRPLLLCAVLHCWLGSEQTAHSQAWPWQHHLVQLSCRQSLMQQQQHSAPLDAAAAQPVRCACAPNPNALAKLKLLHPRGRFL